ncbi:MAG: hypothetical protein SXA11_19460 [Cyanobacteriota bacterium]|nr:hypothetical protein [Cyanobacteriota bacterium]
MTPATKLPGDLNTPENLAIITKMVTQWSRLMAWSWTDYLAFANTENEDQERQLKTVLIETLKKQAQNMEAYVSYGNPDSQAVADDLSRDIENLLLGDNSQVSRLQGVLLTLSDVIQRVTGEGLITTERQYRNFTQQLSFQVVTSKYVGEFAEIPPEVRRSSGESEKKYFAYIAYPPRPELSNLTVTYNDLYTWASSSYPGGNYLPPSSCVPTFT